MLNKKKKIIRSVIHSFEVNVDYKQILIVFVDDIGQIEQMSIDIFIRKAKKT
jgi:hypothetical protein